MEGHLMHDSASLITFKETVS